MEQTPRIHFSDRHIGPQLSEINSMLNALNCNSLDDLINKVAPEEILSKSELDLGKGLGEEEFLKKAETVAKKNKVFTSFIGQGYYNCHTPKVILRNILENPGWYTAYTPYQAEISQGRMEALLNFQTMVADLTGMEISNASLLDEATAAAEAMTLCMNVQRKNKSKRFVVSDQCFPQTIEVVKTRAEYLDIEVLVADVASYDFSKEPAFACLLQYPGKEGQVVNYEALTTKAHDSNTMVIAATDIMALAVLKSPGEWGADIVIGNTQRFGVPMGFGGPHAAYLATKAAYKRNIPGRIIGVSKDSADKPALRLALQTREQHIRREKATSNICTAQVLLGVMASMYAVYHGPQGVKKIASRIHKLAATFSDLLVKNGFSIKHELFYDTVTVVVENVTDIKQRLLQNEINAHYSENAISCSFDETTTLEDLENLLSGFSIDVSLTEDDLSSEKDFAELQRTSSYLTHENFNSYHSETEMLRYIRRLEQKDLSLNHSMIPLGSCTMKLNATSEMIPVTWSEFANIHPFAPLDQAQGYLEMIKELEGWLSEITGFAGASVQPNAGSQGEYAGLLAIKKYLDKKGETQRDLCLIPSSAHGTNPASAVLAGMSVKVVACDDAGNIDFNDLKTKAEENKDRLAALMITYPSTHGVFEEGITEICKTIHDNGGQVYMDGANLNALVGIAKPGEFGPDVCHLNLHKTFCIPHGGGGPGVGPIVVAKHLTPHIPGHELVTECGPNSPAVSAAPWGSASILPISWAYIAMMGAEGLKKATQVSILSANYIAKKLEGHYPVLYKGLNNLVAHECIIDTRPFKDSAGVTVDDIAKRLMDYGFHAPTMSWPVAGTLMIEPTESESLEELDRFCDALISIREEIKEIEEGKIDKENNVLKNAPHSISKMTSSEWDHPYSREQAAFPREWVRTRKFWVPVGRVDNAYGDRNLVCSCPTMDDYK